MKVDTSLPKFFTEGELNRSIQIAEKELEQIDDNEIRSDYSSDYTSGFF